MANAQNGHGQCSRWTRDSLELRLRLVSSRTRRIPPPLLRRHSSKQHLPHVDLGEPASADRRPSPLCNPLRPPFRPALRIGAGDWNDHHRLVLRRLPARLPRPPRHHRLRPHGHHFRHRLGRRGLGSKSRRHSIHYPHLAETSAARHDFFGHQRSICSLDQRTLSCRYRCRCGNGSDSLRLDLWKKSKVRRLRLPSRAMENLGDHHRARKFGILYFRILPKPHRHASRSEPPLLRLGLAWRWMDHF